MGLLKRKKDYSPGDGSGTTPAVTPSEGQPSAGTDDEGDRVQLKREIGVLQGVSIIVGIIIGSGIFVSPIGVLRYTRSVGLSFVMWTVTGLFSLLGAIVYAELGVTIPRSGGEYIYILKTFGAWPAFLCLWITFTAIGCVSLAANSMIFAQYLLQPFFSTCALPTIAVKAVAFVGITTLTGINCYNVKWATKTAVVFTFCKVAALLTITIIGFVYLGLGRVDSFKDPFEGSAYNVGNLALSYYQGFWAFAGWNYLNFLTEEMKNPARNLPMAIIISLTLVTIVYLSTNVAYLAVLSPYQLLNQGSGNAAVAVTFAERTMGVMAWAMPVMVGMSVFGSMNGEILSMSRLLFTGAVEGHMPSVLAMVNYKALTPMPAVLSMFIITVCFLLFDDVFYLIELTGFAFSIIAAMAVSSLLYLRYKHPEMDRPFKLPLVLPIIFLIVNLLIAALTVYQQPMESVLSIALLFAGLPLYLFGVAWTTKPKSLQQLIDNATVGIQKVLCVVPQEKPFDELE